MSRTQSAAPHFLFWAFDLALAGASMMWKEGGPYLLAAAVAFAVIACALHWWRRRTGESQPQVGLAQPGIHVVMGDHNRVGNIGHRGE